MDTCEKCGAKLAVGNELSGRCQNCGEQFYRRDPVPTRSNMEMRNMVSPGEEDQGGNPLQEGILADGGWQNRKVRDESFASVNSRMAKVAGYDDWLEQPYQDRYAEDPIDPQDIDCPECGTKMNQHPTNDYLAVCPNPKCRHELDIDDYANSLAEDPMQGHHYAAAEDDEFNLYRTLVDRARKIQDEQGPEAAQRFIADQENNPDSAWGGDYVFDAVRQTLQGPDQMPNLKQLMPQDGVDHPAGYFSIADMDQQELKKDRGENSSLPDDTPDITHLPPDLRAKDRERWLQDIGEGYEGAGNSRLDRTPSQQLQDAQDTLDELDMNYGPVDQTAPTKNIDIDESRENAKRINDAIYTPQLQWSPGKPGRGALFYGGNDKLPTSEGLIDTPRGKASLHTWPYEPSAQANSPENLMHAEYLKNLGLNPSSPDAMKGASLFYITPEGQLEAVGQTNDEAIGHITQADPRLQPPNKGDLGFEAFGSVRNVPHGSWLVESDADFEIENADVLPPDHNSWDGEDSNDPIVQAREQGVIDEPTARFLLENRNSKVAFLGGIGDAIGDAASWGFNAGQDIGLIPENGSLGELAGTAAWLLPFGAGAAIKTGLAAKALAGGASKLGIGAGTAAKAAEGGSKLPSVVQKAAPWAKNYMAMKGTESTLNQVNPMNGVAQQPQPLMPARTLQQMAKAADFEHPSSDPIMHEDQKEHSDNDHSAPYPFDDVNEVGGTYTGDPDLDKEFDEKLPVMVMYYLSGSSAKDSKDPDMQKFLSKLDGHGLLDDTGIDHSILEPLWDIIDKHLDSLGQPEEKTEDDKEHHKTQPEKEEAIGIGTQSGIIHDVNMLAPLAAPAAAGATALYEKLRHGPEDSGPACEVCGKPAPEDPREEGWISEPDEGGPDAYDMWQCPDCQRKWSDDGELHPHSVHASMYDRYADVQNLPGAGTGSVPRPPQAPAAPQAPSATPGTANCPRCGAPMSPGATTCPSCGSGVGTAQQAPQPGQVLAYSPYPGLEQQSVHPGGSQPIPQGTTTPAKCPHCGATGQQGATCGMCGQSLFALPQAQPQQQTAKTGADHQGPHNNEQFAAVADLLTEEGRQDEIPAMLAEPWNYAEELARAQNKKNMPPIDDTQTAAPPMPAQEEAPPEATMPVPGMQMPQQPMSSTGSEHEKTAESINHHEAENPIVAPADIQHEPEDIRAEQDSSLQWQDTNGEPLKAGQEYEMESPSWTIPDIVIVKNVKPDGIVVEIQSEYGLNARTEIDKHEAELEQYTFTPSGDSSIDQPIEDNLGTPDDQRQRLAPGEQSDLSTPHMNMASSTKESVDNVSPRCPKCGSASTGLIGEEGDIQCHSCGNRFKKELMKDPTLSYYRCPQGHVCAARRTASNLQCPECGSPLDPGTGLGRGVDPESIGLQDHPSPAAFTSEDPSISPQQQTTPIQPQAKQAGAKFSPFEQREFVDESGVARNKDKLKLDGTHYAEDENDDYLLFDW